MTAQEFLKQYHDDNPNDWLYQKRQVLATLLKSYASQQRTEGIREGFEAARALKPPTDIKKTDHGVEVLEPFKYLTVEDYLNRNNDT